MAEPTDDPFEAEAARREAARDPFEAEYARRQKARTPPASSVSDIGWQLPQGFNEGLDQFINLPYNVLARWPAKLAGYNLPEGQYARRFNSGKAPETTTGKYAHSVGEVLGASVVPSAGILSKAEQLAALAPTTVPRAMGQTIGELTAASPGRAVAADVAGSVGAGIGQEAAKEAGFGAGSQMLAGAVGAMTPVGLMMGANKAVDITRHARANAQAHQRLNKGLGDTSLDDLSNAVATGHTGIDSGKSRFALDVLGEEMVKTGGDRQAAYRAAIDRIAEQSVVPDAADRITQQMAKTLREGGNPFPHGTPQEEMDAFIRAIVNGEREAVGANAYPTISAAIEQGARTRATETAADHLRRVMQAHADNELMLGEYPAVMRADVETRGAKGLKSTDEALAAIEEPGIHRQFDYIANAGSMASSQNVRNAVAARARGLKDSTEEAIAGLSPESKSIQDVSEMLAAATKKAGDEYKIVHNPANQLVDNGKLVGGLQAVIDKYANVARTRGGDARAAIEKALEEFFYDYGGQKLVLPNLQMAQDMRGALRGQKTEFARRGRDDLAGVIEPMYKDVTAAMRAASPRWWEANKKWADLDLEDVAQKLGDAFSTKAGPLAREQMETFRGLAPEAQDIVRVHFTQKLLDMIENAAKLGGGKNLGDLFTKGPVLAKIREILGPEAAVAVARLARDANVIARTRDMMRGSPTAPRQQMIKEQEADMRVAEAALNFDWRNWRQAVWEKIVAFAMEKQNKKVAKTITTPMRDVPAVAEQLERMKQARALAERYAMPRGGRDSRPLPAGSLAGSPLTTDLQDFIDEQGRLNVNIPRRP